MGTTHNHDLAAASTLGESDQYPTINASTGRGAYVTGAQLRAFAGGQGGLVSATASTLAVTAAAHAGRTVVLNRGAGCTATLPAATGTGNRYRFVVGTTSTAYVIQVTTDDTMNGQFMLLDNDAAAQASYAAISGDDTLTMNATTKGGQVGDWFECQDIAADVWSVTGCGVVPAGSNPADPFSAAVS